MNHLIRLLKEEDGQATTEYGLLVGLLVIAVIAAVAAFGGNLATIFSNITTKIGTVIK